MATIFVPKGTTDISGLGIASGDYLMFNEGSQTITAGLDLSGLAAGLIGIGVGPAFTGWIGTGSSSLRCDVDAGAPNEVLYQAGGGGMYLRPGGGHSLVTKVTHMGIGTIHLTSGGTVTNLEQVRGTTYVPDVVAVTNIFCSGGQIIQAYSGTANTSWRVAGGSLVTGRGFSGTARIGRNSHVIVRREDSSTTLPTGGTWEIAGRDDGRHAVEWHGQNVGTVTLLDERASIDMSNVFVDASITILGPAAALRRCRLESKYKHVTITATMTSYGGDPDSIGEVSA